MIPDTVDGDDRDMRTSDRAVTVFCRAGHRDSTDAPPLAYAKDQQASIPETEV
jgi:hypothetical protein